MAKSPTSTVSVDTATATAQKYARQMIEVIPPKRARLMRFDDGDFAVPTYCSDLDGPPKGTPINFAFSYWIKGVEREDVKRYFADFRRHLSGEGWKRLYGSLESGGLAMGKGEYSLLLVFAPSNGRLSLSAETPCVAPKDPDHPFDVPPSLR